MLSQPLLSDVTQPKACKVCGGSFLPFTTTQTVCGVRCALRVPKLAKKAARLDRQVTRARLDELRPLAYWVKQAQVAFNAWIRVRDEARPCISCGAPKASQWDAGHYLSAGARPDLRFDEANCHKQCSMCNQHFSGNVVRYRIELVKRIGQTEVDRLEGPHEPRRLRADDLKAIRDEYRARIKVPARELAEVF